MESFYLLLTLYLFVITTKDLYEKRDSLKDKFKNLLGPLAGKGKTFNPTG